MGLYYYCSHFALDIPADATGVFAVELSAEEIDTYFKDNMAAPRGMDASLAKNGMRMPFC